MAPSLPTQLHCDREYAALFDSNVDRFSFHGVLWSAEAVANHCNAGDWYNRLFQRGTVMYAVCSV